jgi:hypothetical protein
VKTKVSYRTEVPLLKKVILHKTVSKCILSVPKMVIFTLFEFLTHIKIINSTVIYYHSYIPLSFPGQMLTLLLTFFRGFYGGEEKSQEKHKCFV